MKIVHIALNYIDGLGYQENLLPLYQKRAGHDVVVISSSQKIKRSFLQSALQKEILNRGREYYFDDLKICRINTYLNISSTSFICRGLKDILEKENPDVIFHHNVGLATLTMAVNYKRSHPEIKLYVDNHADWVNESKNRLWHRFFYDYVMPLQVKRVGNKVDYYIGVSPMRCQYLKKVFKVPEDKVCFLPIGCDTDQVAQVIERRDELKAKYSLPVDAFVVVSGGKIDHSKGTLELIAACNRIMQQGEKVNLVLFGKIDEEVGAEAAKHDWIKCLGWCDRLTTLSILKMADVACWPWLHTTLIEDSVASGTPIVVKMSDNVSHFAAEKAGMFMKYGDVEEIINALRDAKIHNGSLRKNVLIARDKYSYATLVKKLDKESFCEVL